MGNRFPLLGGVSDLKARLQCAAVGQIAIAAVGMWMELHTNPHFIYLSIFMIVNGVVGKKKEFYFKN